MSVPPNASLGGSNSNVHSTVAYSQIASPPFSNQERLGWWKKSSGCWVEINDDINEGRLLASLGVNATPILKGFLPDYFETAKTFKVGRSPRAFLDVMEVKFQRLAAERTTLRTQHRNSFGRKMSDVFREYWMRYERLMSKLAMEGVVWAGASAYQKAFSTLMLTHDQHVLARAMMEVAGNSGNINELKRVTIKLFDSRLQPLGDICVRKLDSGADQCDEQSGPDLLTDIAPGAAPLLISLEVMRTLGMCLDIKMEKMWVIAVSFPLISPRSGHVPWKLIPRDKGWIQAPSRNDSGEPIDKLHVPSDLNEKANPVRTGESTSSTADGDRSDSLSSTEIQNYTPTCDMFPGK